MTDDALRSAVQQQQREVERAAGGCLLAFSELEGMIHYGIRMILRLTGTVHEFVEVMIAGDRGPELGRSWRSLHGLLRVGIERLGGDERATRLLAALNTEVSGGSKNTLIKRRNDLMHGLWSYDFESIEDVDTATPLKPVIFRITPAAQVRLSTSVDDLDDLASQCRACALTIIRVAGVVAEAVESGDAAHVRELDTIEINHSGLARIPE